jgi:hypothetical protein
MRAFNVTVYDGWVNGTNEVRSDANLTEVVGRADDLAVQIYVDDSSGVGITMTVKAYHANDATNWVERSTLMNAVDISTIPSNQIIPVPLPLGADVLFGVQLGGTSPKARVKIMVCGRLL